MDISWYDICSPQDLFQGRIFWFWGTLQSLGSVRITPGFSHENGFLIRHRDWFWGFSHFFLIISSFSTGNPRWGPKMWSLSDYNCLLVIFFYRCLRIFTTFSHEFWVYISLLSSRVGRVCPLVPAASSASPIIRSSPGTSRWVKTWSLPRILGFPFSLLDLVCVGKYPFSYDRATNSSERTKI